MHGHRAEGIEDTSECSVPIPLTWPSWTVPSTVPSCEWHHHLIHVIIRYILRHSVISPRDRSHAMSFPRELLRVFFVAQYSNLFSRDCPISTAFLSTGPLLLAKNSRPSVVTVNLHFLLPCHYNWCKEVLSEEIMKWRTIFTYLDT